MYIYVAIISLGTMLCIMSTEHTVIDMYHINNNNAIHNKHITNGFSSSPVTKYEVTTATGT